MHLVYSTQPSDAAMEASGAAAINSMTFFRQSLERKLQVGSVMAGPMQILSSHSCV